MFVCLGYYNEYQLINQSITIIMSTISSSGSSYQKLMTPTTLLSLLLVHLMTSGPEFIKGVNSQFNEPPGQRREQTYRILEYELSSINQHYPGDLRYYCTFRGKWSEERHPFDFPSAASWSAPTIISHSKNYRMWTGTETVTAGVEYVAEVSLYLYFVAVVIAFFCCCLLFV